MTVRGAGRAAAPQFRDPIGDGAADPAVIWDPHRQHWRMFYTARRANVAGPGVAWVHGTSIATAHYDHAGTWVYDGTVAGLAQRTDRPMTYWAPEVVHAEGQFHMYVTVIEGVPDSWRGAATIQHYTSADLGEWRYRSTLDLGAHRVIDACVIAKPGHGYRMWFKNEDAGGHTYSADSDDLLIWRPGAAVLTHAPHEGPNVFALAGHYWMIVDEWCGQAVFRSDDLESWSAAGRILADSSPRSDDAGPGLHADVVTVGDLGYVFYFTHPGRHPADRETRDFYEQRRSTVHLATLTVEGGQLRCDRLNPSALPVAPLDGR